MFHTYLDHLNRLENLQSLQLSDKEVDALALQILATACLPRLRCEKKLLLLMLVPMRLFIFRGNL